MFNAHKRQQDLWTDTAQLFMLSYENPEVIWSHQEYLGSPGNERAHDASTVNNTNLESKERQTHWTGDSRKRRAFCPNKEPFANAWNSPKSLPGQFEAVFIRRPLLSTCGINKEE